MSDMTPDEARELIEIFKVGFLPDEDLPEMHRALATLANMRAEHDHGVVDWEQVDGRYEKFHRVRLVGEWKDA